MSDNAIKEHLSNHFLGIIAANKGYMVDKPSDDYGVDYQVSRLISRSIASGGNRYIKDNKYIDIQLKATTEDGIIHDSENNVVKYDLEVKNFNDLVMRSDRNNLTPLVLILFVLPDARDTWVEILGHQISLRKCAYWFNVSEGTPLSTNTATVRISIPFTNILNADCFDSFYNQFYI